MTHHPDHEQWLQRLLTEPEAAVPEERAALQACAECREILQTLTAAAAQLDAAGADEGPFLAAALAQDPAAGERAARVFAARHLVPTAPARRRPWLPMLVATAALAVLGWYLLHTPSPPRPTRLGGGSVDLVAPLGAGGSYGVFQWRGPDRADLRYDLEIFDDPPGGRRTRLFRASTKDRPWDPSQAGCPTVAVADAERPGCVEAVEHIPIGLRLEARHEPA